MHPIVQEILNKVEREELDSDAAVISWDQFREIFESGGHIGFVRDKGSVHEQFAYVGTIERVREQHLTVHNETIGADTAVKEILNVLSWNCENPPLVVVWNEDTGVSLYEYGNSITIDFEATG